MTIEDVIELLGLSNSDFKTDGKQYIHEIEDSDAFAHLFNLFDSSEQFEEDLDAQDINLLSNTVVFIDETGNVECTLFADFENDEYTLQLAEV